MRAYLFYGDGLFENQLKAKLTLKPGMKVLSVGCGIGGGECRLHQMFGVHVHGLDLSQNMLAVARQRAAEMNITSGVEFEFGNVLIRDFEEGSFDVVYTRDCIIHIREKDALFQRFYKWLKPGGQLLISGKQKNDFFKIFHKKFGQKLKIQIILAALMKKSQKSSGLIWLTENMI